MLDEDDEDEGRRKEKRFAQVAGLGRGKRSGKNDRRTVMKT